MHDSWIKCLARSHRGTLKDGIKGPRRRLGDDVEFQEVTRTSKINHLKAIHREGHAPIAKCPETAESLAGLEAMTSLLEQKRLQWAAERAQMKEWDPWGRPGGGAPLATAGRTTLPNPPDSRNTWNKISTMHLPPLSTISGSMPNGNPRLVAVPLLGDPNGGTWKDETNNMEWKAEQDGASEESRQPPNIHEKDIYDKQILANNLINRGAVPLNNLSGGVDDGPKVGTRFDSSSTVENWREGHRSSASVESNNAIADDDESYQKSNGAWPQRTFLRGANIPMDTHSQVELAAKKEKAMEQQKAIRSQLEEQQRRKQAEQERRRQEEQEEEARLGQERQRLQRQYLMEQQKLKHKEEMDVQRREALSEALQEAHKSLKILPEERQGPAHQLPDVLNGTPKSTPHSEVHYGTSALNPIDGTLMPYVYNRVLTPTKYRGQSIVMRDCGTQTEVPFVGVAPSRKDQSTTMADAEVTEKGQRSKSRVNKKKLNKTGTKKQKQQWGTGNDSRVSESVSTNSKCPSRSQEAKVLEHRKMGGHRDQDAARGSRVACAQRTRSRSSAEHRRRPLPRERAPSLGHYSPPNATPGGAVISDETATPPSRESRKPRRQWESPRRNEIPTFFTDSPQLMDLRTSRRSSSVPKKPGSITDPSSPKDEPDVANAAFRSDSPPVPALRRRMTGENPAAPEPWPPMLDNRAFNQEREWAGNNESKTLKESRDSEASGNRVERLNLPDITCGQNGHGMVNKGEQSDQSHASMPSLRSNPSMPKPANGCLTAPSLVQDENLRKSTWSLATPSVEQQEQVLQKLTLIREGLLLKQRELDRLVEKFDNLTNECHQLDFVKSEHP